LTTFFAFTFVPETEDPFWLAAFEFTLLLPEITRSVFWFEAFAEELDLASALPLSELDFDSLLPLESLFEDEEALLFELPPEFESAAGVGFEGLSGLFGLAWAVTVKTKVKISNKVPEIDRDDFENFFIYLA